MNRTLITLIAVLSLLTASGATKPAVHYVEASQLTLLGKLIDTPANPYHRVDTARYHGFDARESEEILQSAGLAVAFKTTSRSIKVLTDYGQVEMPTNSNGIASRGYDLYIRNNKGEWQYAESGVKNDKNLHDGKPLNLISNLPAGEKECLLYLPLFAEVRSVKVGVDAGATLEPLLGMFRHRIAFFGSSFTHGTGCSRPGMAYPAQFERLTGLQSLGFGMSGHCKMQPYYTAVLADAKQVDAFIFDAFSNPTPEQVKTRLIPFIETLQKAHPGVPIIFQRTIHRENTEWDLGRRKTEDAKLAMQDSMMYNVVLKRYNDVYYVRPYANTDDHNSTVDGVHPSQAGYTVWAKSLAAQVLPILKRYGIE